MALIITDDDVREHFTMRQCITAVRAGYAAAAPGELQTTDRSWLQAGDQARLLTLSAVSRSLGTLVSLAYTGAPVGADRNTSPVSQTEKVYTVFDSATGACSALIGGNHLAWLKTGATGAVAIDALARQDARSLALVGSGRQAASALLGAMEVRPFDDVRVWSRQRQHAARFVEQHAGTAPVRAVDGVQQAVADADVVVTVTTSHQPIVQGAWLAAGSHANSIGAHYPDQRELDTDAVAGATVFVDTRHQAMAEKGELIQAAEEGRFAFEEVEAELGDVVSGRHPWRREAAERTFFASCGSAIETLAAASAVLEQLGARPGTRQVALNGR